MKHYDITIIGSYQLYTRFKKKFKNRLKILFVERFRNSIQTEDGYVIVFSKEKKNIQISTDILIRLDT
ncbi:MAG: hypothetical protein DSZ10_02820 [Sulfurovum sp.]|nr:MAG: hypothetical protein DSZ10_02820 [Sulfurovum sp.]